MTDITKYTISQLKAQLASKKISAIELTKAYLEQSKKLNPELNIYIDIVEEHALNMAKNSDKNIQTGKAGLLEGIPLAIKDNFCTKNIKTQCASHILDSFTPPYEATVTQNLWDNGAILLGKLNMDEFAMGSANITSYFGPAINPLKSNNHNEKLTPGGSSGGSAAAVRANLCAAAMGSDTGGSVRQPASFTGLTGLKPTYGRCSRFGLIAFASSLDQAGPITHDVTDAALMLNAIAGHDVNDSTSAQKDQEDFTRDLEKDIKGFKIGIPKEYKLDDLDPDIIKNLENSIKVIQNLGAEIIEISLPHTEYAAPTYYIISTAEASSNLSRYDGVRYGLRITETGDSLDDMYAKTRSAGFGDEVKRRIMVGNYVLSSGYYDAYYKKAQKLRNLITQDFKAAFKDVSAILTPTTPNAAFRLDQKPSILEMYYNDIFTVSANLTGLPAISIPSGVNKENLPLGVQLISPLFSENLLFRVARNLEKELAFQASTLNYRI